MNPWGVHRYLKTRGGRFQGSSSQGGTKPAMFKSVAPASDGPATANWQDPDSGNLDGTGTSTLSHASSQGEESGPRHEKLALRVEFHLLDAAGRGQIEKVQQAVAEGASVNCLDPSDRSPLMIAASAGFTAICRYLLQQGAELNHRDKKGSYALREAVMNGHQDLRDLLLEHGAVIDSKDELDLGQQMCLKAAAGELDTMRQLLACRASVNAVMHDQRTALHLAAAEGHVDVIAFLLEQKADPVLRDRWGGTALLDATRGCHSRAAALLRAAIGSADAFADASGGLPQPPRNQSVSMLAYDEYPTLQISQLQVDPTAHRGGPGSASSTGSAEPVFELSDGEKMCKAAATGDMKCLRKLVARGADVNANDYDKRSALHLAAAEGVRLYASILIGTCVHTHRHACSHVHTHRYTCSHVHTHVRRSQRSSIVPG